MAVSIASAGSNPRVMRFLEIAFGAVVVIHLWENLRFKSRGVKRRASGWFDVVDRRKRGQLFDAEVDFLAKMLARAASAASAAK